MWHTLPYMLGKVERKPVTDIAAIAWEGANLAVEGQAADKNKVCEDAHCPDVYALVIAPVLANFRGNIPWRA